MLCGQFNLTIILAAQLLAALVSPTLAAEFDIAVPNGATSSQVDSALATERAHRKLFPSDTIVLALPNQLSRTTPIMLGAQDSGLPNAPLILRGAAGAGSTITGAALLDSEQGLDPSTASLSNIPPAAQSRVRRVRLPTNVLAATSPAFVANGSFVQSIGQLYVFEGERRLTPTRWPTSGYATSPTVVGPPTGYASSPMVVAGGSASGVTIQLPVSIAGLDQEPDLWVSGFWGWNWWFETRKAISVFGSRLTFAKPDSPVNPGARYRLFNLAAGLDHSGVYYRAATDGSLYFIPDATNPYARLSVAVAWNVLNINSAANVRVENVAFEKTIGTAVLVQNSSGVVLQNCYVGHSGASGIIMNGGTNNQVVNCVVDDIGRTGISIGGGDRNTLTSANDLIHDTRISNFGREMPSYQPGVQLGGVGVTVSGCEIAFGPHAGLVFVGNDHQIVGNMFHDLVLDTSDAGAIYTDRNWTVRGNVIASNYFHDITNKVDASAVVGVYLDDQISGATVDANVFYRVDQPILVGGGRDNIVRNNLAVASKGSPIYADQRGLTWEAAMAAPGGVLRNGLATVPYQTDVWAQRYPTLVTILGNRPGAPVNNSYVNNLFDQGPPIKYDLPATAGFGVETGSRQMVVQYFNFPTSPSGAPADAPAAVKIEATRGLINQAQQAMRNLPFSSNLNY